ncbi:MAG: DNA mismatch repair endonuclease MutL [Syntrophobacterales bacterium]|nr:DNA mismatch repair endonuclease MutL [Syntrophobacterales bacterium]
MGRIELLEPATAAKIAAGEVITRPAAVVKELVENALDAGARHISIRLEEGGRRRLLVADDGGGMEPEDVPLAILRHATSKIRREEDLLAVSTLGFRGEALASLAAVSRLTLVSRPPGAAAGTRLVVRGGEVLELGPAPAAPGTQVLVEELFYNTPARRKFLKSKEAEQAAVVEVVRQLALGYPEVHFELATPGRTLVSAPAAAGLPERVAALFGPELAQNLVPFELEAGPLGTRGLMSGPDFSLASNRFQTLLVNRRVVHDRLLGAVLKEIYQGRLPRGRHPAALVFLRLPPEQVDVNVHPAKAEVRFREPGRIYSLLLAALRTGLGPLAGERPVYQVSWEPATLPRVAEAGAGVGAPHLTATVLPFPEAIPSSRPAAELPGGRFQDLTLLGQLLDTYLLAQSPAGLVIIDQHAAHERVLYERLGEIRPTRQALLFPRVVEVSPAQAEWVADHLEVLAELGLTLEPFGGASFLLTAAPACLAGVDLEAAVLEAVEAASPIKSGRDPEAVRQRARLALACRGAVKAGQTLSPEEMHSLLVQLDEVGGPATCPHGRPLWRLISLAELHHSFRRPPG